jgi:hypothetical protein
MTTVKRRAAGAPRPPGAAAREPRPRRRRLPRWRARSMTGSRGSAAEPGRGAGSSARRRSGAGRRQPPEHRGVQAHGPVLASRAGRRGRACSGVSVDQHRGLPGRARTIRLETKLFRRVSAGGPAGPSTFRMAARAGAARSATKCGTAARRSEPRASAVRATGRPAWRRVRSRPPPTCGCTIAPARRRFPKTRPAMLKVEPDHRPAMSDCVTMSPVSVMADAT